MALFRHYRLKEAGNTVSNRVLTTILALDLVGWGLVGNARAQQAPVQPAPPGNPPIAAPGSPLLYSGGPARFSLRGKVLKDLEYARVDGKPLLLDLYLPDGGDRRPVVVWVHGGGWMSGSKDDCPARPLTFRGYAVASINYRLSQQAQYPAQIEDCKGAVRWLRAHAAQYNLDPNRIGAWGASAGGHLVALLGTTGDVKDLEGNVGGNLKESSRVQAVCDWFGPTDFLTIGNFSSTLNHNGPDSPEAHLLGGPILQNKEKAVRANPITWVTPDDPPFLIMHGDRDPLVPLNQSQILADALKKAGVKATLVVVHGAGHGDGDFRTGESLRAVVDFFDRALRPAAVH